MLTDCLCNFFLASAIAFNVSTSSKSCFLFISSNFLLAFSSIWSPNILGFSVSLGNLKKLLLDFTDVLVGLGEDLDPFGEYLDHTESSSEVIFEFLHKIWVFQKIGL